MVSHVRTSNYLEAEEAKTGVVRILQPRVCEEIRCVCCSCALKDYYEITRKSDLQRFRICAACVDHACSAWDGDIWDGSGRITADEHPQEGSSAISSPSSE